MEKNLCKFTENTEILGKDFSKYKDEEGNMFVFNTVHLLARVDVLELTKEEYQSALFQQQIDDLDYEIVNVKKAVPKNEITGKDEDKFTITEKEVAVRKIYNVSNGLGLHCSFVSKEEALETAENIDNKVLEHMN